jgi:hypothetical protein
MEEVLAIKPDNDIFLLWDEVCLSLVLHNYKQRTGNVCSQKNYMM